tara:strand:+ start:1564 stop:1821 length:258 start_codon:yes stop_codon:yes gene_type:complete
MSNNCNAPNVELAKSMTIESVPAPVPSGNIQCKSGFTTAICNDLKGSSNPAVREVMKSCCPVTANNGPVYPKPTKHISSKCINDK